MHSRQKINVRAVDFPSNRLTGAKMNSPEETQVVVTNIQMPPISMVVFMVKRALAAIPSLFILMAIFTGIFFALGMTVFY